MKAYNTTIILVLLGSLLFSSCAKEEFNDLELTSDNTVVIPNNFFIDGTSETFEGCYSICPQTANNRGVVHRLCYASEFIIREDQGIAFGDFTGNPYILEWETTSEQLNQSSYLAEGYYFRDSIEMPLCYNLFITEKTDFTISGYFETTEDSPIYRLGEFSTGKYPCDVIFSELQPKANFPSGRIYTQLNGVDHQNFMSQAINCEEVKVIYGAEKPGIIGSSIAPHEPQFIIVIDRDEEYRIGSALKAYYITETNGILTEGNLSDYETAISRGTVIDVIISSDGNELLIGQFSGQLDNGANIFGQFRSNYLAC